MSEREAPGDFDYLFEDIPDEPGGDAPADAQAGDTALLGDAYPRAQSGQGPNLQFDPFDSTTWYFEPAPPPWYRTKRTLPLFVASAAATVALVVSGVLLVLRGPGYTTVDEITPVTQTAPTTAAIRPPSRTSAPPPPPAPPAETSAASIAPVPVQTNRPRTPSTRTTKEPEIGVTRTPVTRSPISVAPQRPGGTQR